MVDDVAKAICREAGQHQRVVEGESAGYAGCQNCDQAGNCTLLATFRNEARVAIVAAYRWHKRERRWPGFVEAK